ncbi:trehalose-6-phosphate synthase [Aeromicrobium sp. YIM 150415]|uniref:Trehalose-6-phosphate synthase n=1 Tax=Aeromicrobium piscarium TaxID=2590901 RepID=A0A554SPE9_9ACTN|nr:MULTISPECIES: trehalose-6-phosphate synthase [Aeromicrobium]MBM9462335.1 trehalose-6-phosphate synthase [Aeromicrobium sp. YIM 150415]TSD68236.1 trehalose-6-phosphate synthase [Aeromicrobium piscarium]
MPREQPDFVVIANRLPVDRVTSPDGEVLWRTSPGGLVTALEPVMRRHDGAWIGWHGAADEKLRPFDHAGMHLVPIPLTEDDVQEYYEGFSNATLWPLYHDVIAAPEYHREWWDAYVRVNRRFAKKAAQIAAEGATVWVQDYQLQLVPQMLRALRPDLRIGFFLHIPFPPTELYQQLPWRREILEGLLGADLVGFQAPGAAQNFIRLVRQRVGHKTHRDTVYLPDGRTVLAKAYPISIDAEGFETLSRTPEVQARAAEIRESLGNPETVLLGIDRLDYTKGLPQRLRAFGELVADGLVQLDDVKFIQIATPSRERVNSYKLLRDNINQLVGRINGDIGRIGQQPIQYLHASYPREEMAAMYRAADVMVVTPLRDGMNLVAKEYIATRWDNRGALVLSEFAGAAAELKQAYLVNPHDINGLKQKMLEAINASGRETSRRMKALRKQVMENDIDRWANDFLTELNAQRDPHGKTTRPIS